MKFCDGRVLRQISATLRDGTFGSFRLRPLCDVLGCFSIRNRCSGWHKNGNGGCLSRFSVLFSSAFPARARWMLYIFDVFAPTKFTMRPWFK